MLYLSLFLFYRVPWEHDINNTDETQDEEVFHTLGNVFLDNFPSMDDRTSCEAGTPHGIIHGAEVRGSSLMALDMAYEKYNTLMVIFLCIDQAFKWPYISYKIPYFFSKCLLILKFGLKMGISLYSLHDS